MLELPLYKYIPQQIRDTSKKESVNRKMNNVCAIRAIRRTRAVETVSSCCNVTKLRTQQRKIQTNTEKGNRAPG